MPFVVSHLLFVVYPIAIIRMQYLAFCDELSLGPETLMFALAALFDAALVISSSTDGWHHVAWMIRDGATAKFWIALWLGWQIMVAANVWRVVRLRRESAQDR